MTKIKSLIFLIILLLPIAGWKLNVNHNFNIKENRSLSRMPELSPGISFSSYTTEFEKYFNDNFGFRPLLIQLNRTIRMKILKSSPDATVTLGKNDWLFYTPELDRTENISLQLFSEEELKTVQNNFEEVASFFESKGIKFYVLIAPNSSGIYPEFLPDHLKQLYLNTRLKQLSKYINEGGAKFNYIDPSEDLIKNKGKDDLYYKHDLHWNQLGSFIAYQKLMGRVAKDFPNTKILDLNDYTINYEASNFEDLNNFIGLPPSGKEIHPVLYPKFNSNARIVLKECVDLYNRCGEVLSLNPTAKISRAVVYRDSYGSWLIPFLKEHFQTATYLWQTVPFPVDLVLKEKTDVVIYEVSERSLWTLTQKVFNLN